MSKAYKSLKEDFVSNLSGSSLLDIAAVTSTVPMAVAIYSLLKTRYFKGDVPLPIDFFLNVVVILLATTLYGNKPSALHALLLLPVASLYLSGSLKAPKKSAKPPAPKQNASKSKLAATAQSAALNPLPVKPFLTTYRGSMMIITCLAILGVDFRIFPRKFAKVENWGTSLMDLGVGSFVFSAGVVAARPILKERLSGKATPLGTRLAASIRHAIPLLVLGFVRLWSVKGLEYAEHVTEYGVHWNFFFTLAFLPPFVAVFQSLFHLIPSYELWAVLLAGIYEVALDFTDLKKFILTAERTNLFSQNREGIFSFIGYLAIFLAGQGVGVVVIPRDAIAGAQSGTWEQRKKLLSNLSIMAVVWSALYALTTEYYGLNLSVSRRLANLPYVCYVAAFNCFQLGAFGLIESYLHPEVYKATDAEEEKRVTKGATSKVLNAYNRNGLAIFLAANLLTGLVNLTIATLHVSDPQAMGILLVYAAVVTGLAVGLDRANISIKM